MRCEPFRRTSSRYSAVLDVNKLLYHGLERGCVRCAQEEHVTYEASLPSAPSTLLRIPMSSWLNSITATLLIWCCYPFPSFPHLYILIRCFK